jgi:8-oxo-dGTP pyrophosphatase MutT (NUDIX family)
MTIQKAAACLVRKSARGPELLVFRHPLAGIQIPKGSIETGEDAAEAALRELAEESGVTAARLIGQIGHHEIQVGAGPTESGPPELQAWHTFLLVADRELPDTWSHEVSGSEVETGLVFDFFWLPIAEARSASAPRFHASIDFVVQAVASDAAAVG